VSKQPETRVKEKFLRIVARILTCWAEKIQQVAKGGTPDILGCIKCSYCGDGKFFAAELKKDEHERPTALQLYKMLRIGRAGGLTMIVHAGNLETVRPRLEEYRHPKKSLRNQKVEKNGR
jgi:hypothetical protein